MRRIWFCAAALTAFSTAALAQNFPFEDTFGSYAPGGNGAPAWSVLNGGQWQVQDQALLGPALVRFNGHMPRQFTADLTVQLPDAADWSSGFNFDMQHENGALPSDVVTISGSGADKASVAAFAVGASAPDLRQSADVPVVSKVPVRLRLVVDADASRYAVFVDDKIAITSRPMEYAPGLIGVELSGGARITRVAFRAPSADETDSLRLQPLLNDPRDIAASDDGFLLILHRSSPAIMGITVDGEIVRKFGRRTKAYIPDPVAMSVDTKGAVFVLNRFPGEVVVFERNGGVRKRFGAGHLAEPIDLALAGDGSIYVADAGAKRVSIFSSAGVWLNDVSAFGDAGGTPRRIAVDSLGNVLLTLAAPDRTVTLRPTTNNDLAVETSRPLVLADAANLDAVTYALHDSTVSAWPPSATAPAFKAAAAHGLDADGRITKFNGRLYILNRAGGRIVEAPAKLVDVVPTAAFANIARSAVTVSWTSPDPSLRSRIQVLRGTTWDTLVERHPKAVGDHQVTIAGLPAGKPVRFRVSPSLNTIPPVEWSADYIIAADGTVSPATDTID